MNETSANLIERILPRTGLRQWVLTFPFPWRRRLSQDGALLGRLTRILVETVMAFYIERGEKDAQGAKTGAVTVVQRTSSDLRLNPHLHAVILDGTWKEQAGELVGKGLGHLKTSDVGEVLQCAALRTSGTCGDGASSPPSRMPSRTPRTTPRATSRRRRFRARRRRPDRSG
jgi:hypothetical protein